LRRRKSLTIAAGHDRSGGLVNGGTASLQAKMWRKYTMAASKPDTEQRN
jgi:hypothetical protein